MLFKLPNAEDKQFSELIEKIKQAYYSEDQYKAYKDLMPGWENPPDADGRAKQIESALNEVIDKVCRNNELYCVAEGSEALSSFTAFPFVDRFHRYFLQRKWTFPSLRPRIQYNNIFDLHPPDQTGVEAQEDSELFRNYSKNSGDYNHFLNVVMATARLVNFFSDGSEIEELLPNPNKKLESSQQQYYTDLAADLAYGKETKLREFQLMLGAFYHDLGKTVDYHRHGMEGATILANNVFDAVYHFQKICDGYGLKRNKSKRSFERDDLLYVALLISYHDLFGTLCTGEAGYLRLVDLIQRLQKNSIRDQLDKQQLWGRRHIFDLWVLNLADILVSLGGRKLEYQKDLENKKTADERIREFLKEKKCLVLQHDLRVSMKLLDSHNTMNHVDDIGHLETAALQYSKRHFIDRIGRLLRCLLVDRHSELIDRFEYSSTVVSILKEVENFSDRKWHSIITRCIYSEGDYSEFAHRFCWIGQLDYAFSFFNKILERALESVADATFDLVSTYEVKLKKTDNDKNADFPQNKENNPVRDGISVNNWIVDRPGYSTEFSAQMNAEFFVDNYTSTVMQIIEHLVFREKEISKMRNLEFWVAGNRLTKEKIDRILSLQGPYRTRRSIHLALESIFIW